MKRWISRVPRGWIVLGLAIASWLMIFVVVLGVCMLISCVARRSGLARIRDSAYVAAMTIEEMTPEAATTITAPCSGGVSIMLMARRFQA